MHISALLAAGISVVVAIVVLFAVEKDLNRKASFVLSTLILTLFLMVPWIFGTRLPDDLLKGDEKQTDLVEGLAANLTVVEGEDETRLKIDRLWQGSNKRNHQIMAAHIPMILHQDPKEVCVIGMGTGQTASRFLMYDIEHIDVVDIEKELPQLVRKHFSSSWMNDRRFRFVTEDGRNYLRNTEKTYDVISIEVGQVFRPQCASFYSVDFYSSITKSLNRNGLVAQFLPIIFFSEDQLKSAVLSFIEVFKNASLWFNRGEFILIGSIDSEIVLTPKRLNLLQTNEKIKRDLEYSYWGGNINQLNNPGTFSAGFLLNSSALEEMAGDVEIYSDEIPVLEYETSAVESYDSVKVASILKLVKSHLSSPAGILKKEYPGDVVSRMEKIQKLNIDDILAGDMVGLYLSSKEERHLRKAHALNPHNTEVMLLVASRMIDKRQFDQAEEILGKLLEVTPQNAAAHNNMGLLHSRKGTDSQAIEFYRRAHKLDKSSANILNNLGVSLCKIERYDEARRVFEKALSIDPTFEKTHNNLKILNQNVGE